MEQKKLMLATLCDPRFKSPFSASILLTRHGLLSYWQQKLVSDVLAVTLLQSSLKDRNYCPNHQPVLKENLQTVGETVELQASQKSLSNNPRPYSQEVQNCLNERLTSTKSDPLIYWREHGA